MSRFPTHPHQRSKWSSQELLFGILQDDFHRPKKVSAFFFQADKNNLKNLVTMFICLNQAEKTSKQSPINVNPNDQAKYSTHTLISAGYNTQYIQYPYTHLYIPIHIYTKYQLYRCSFPLLNLGRFFNVLR